MTIATAIQWSLADLQKHLQYAVDLEFWTIPFYMASKYSVSGDTKKLIMSVAVQEMFHFQCACNIANAFNAFPADYQFPVPQYSGQRIPHLNFALDQPNPAKTSVQYPPGGKTYDFTHYSAELGAADTPRINTMCLIEYPNWNPLSSCQKKGNITTYGSIGHFYDAIKIGIQNNKSLIKGNQKQQNLFRSDFPGMRAQTITQNGEEGYSQVLELLEAITIQGEGSTVRHDAIPYKYQDQGGYKYEPDNSHFEKFLELYHNPPAVKQPTKPIEPAIQKSLQDFLSVLTQIFVKGETTTQIWPTMHDLGIAIQACY